MKTVAIALVAVCGLIACGKHHASPPVKAAPKHSWHAEAPDEQTLRIAIQVVVRDEAGYNAHLSRLLSSPSSLSEGAFAEELVPSRFMPTSEVLLQAREELIKLGLDVDEGDHGDFLLARIRVKRCDMSGYDGSRTEKQNRDSSSYYPGEQSPQ